MPIIFPANLRRGIWQSLADSSLCNLNIMQNANLFRCLLLLAALSLTGCHHWQIHQSAMPFSPVDSELGVIHGSGSPCENCGNEETWRQYTIRGRIKNALTCGSGCGDLYWGEWSYNRPPPKGCGKTDMDGNWIGPPVIYDDQ